MEKGVLERIFVSKDILVKNSFDFVFVSQHVLEREASTVEIIKM